MITMSQQEFLATSGLPAHTLVLWIEQRWLIPGQSDAGLSFSERDVARARLIRDLQHDLGVNDEGIHVVLHLMDQLHGLRAALAHFRGTQD